MRLCLTCRRLSPGGTVYCTQCACTWGCRICPRGHRNAMRSLFCGTCGIDDLTTATAYLPLGWLNRCLTTLMLVGVWRWLFHHGRLVGRGVFAIAALALSILFDTTPGTLCSYAIRMVIWLSVIYGLITFSPAAISRPIRKVVNQSLDMAKSLIRKVVALTLSGIGRLLQP